jgi:hypothetical protein
VTAPDSDVVFVLEDVGSDSARVIVSEVSAIGLASCFGGSAAATMSGLRFSSGAGTEVCDCSLSPDRFGFDDMRDWAMLLDSCDSIHLFIGGGGEWSGEKMQMQRRYGTTV